MISRLERTRFFANHMVSISTSYMGGGRTEPGYFVVTCFVMVVRGYWFLITAGHTIDYIEKKKEDGALFASWDLKDSWGLDSKDKTTIPFPFFDTPGIRVLSYNDAINPAPVLDYAVFRIQDVIIDLLIANNIQPLGIDTDYPDIDEEFDSYLVLGFPNELVSIESLGGTEFKVRYGLAELTLARLTDPPEYLKRPFDCFYGVITGGLARHIQGGLKSVEGMSGGPIFGIKNNRYSLLAMQSSWDEKDKVVGVGMKAFTLWLDAEIGKLLEAENQQEGNEAE